MSDHTRIAFMSFIVLILTLALIGTDVALLQTEHAVIKLQSQTK